MAISRFIDDTRDSRHQLLSEEGKIYSVATGSQSIDASGYLALEVTNPADSNKMIEVIRIEGGTLTTTTIDILRNAPLAVSGFSLSPLNRNWNCTDSSAMTVKYITQATDPTSGGDLLTSVIQTSGKISMTYDGEFVLPGTTSDNHFSLRIKNNTSEANTLSVSITWLEP
ncbi:MAG: hypothetical protein CVU90_05325 [Firmicutes bacterium HGW-Firmicutes-15]|nr:MAG: hypothetical protein CVU90_05325 [Firmicutes bacterium HGW-Firmicutes-15]